MHQQITTCLNGTYLPSNQAMLPIADRGFRFGDGLFETVRLVDGVPYQWKLHLSRLSAGLAALRIAPPTVDWKEIVREMVAKNSARDGYLRISISRGVGSRGYLPDADIHANWAMEYLPPTAAPEAPCRLWLSSITRPAPSALPVNCKLAHGIGSTLALLDARDNHCDEALMLSADDHISEASSGNIFWLKGAQLYTPALTTGCLAGTTRAAIMRLAGVVEIHAQVSEFIAADAAFISNARLGIWAVAALLPNKKTYDANHPRIRELTAMLNADCASYVAANAKDWA
jgi:branched-chain amino acid aminotransferase